MNEDDLENRLNDARNTFRVTMVLFLLIGVIAMIQLIHSRRLIGAMFLLIPSTNIYIALRYGLIWALYTYLVKNKDSDFWLQFGLNCFAIIFFIFLMVFAPDSGPL